MQPQITKFLSGGLNLLTAGDQVPEGLCIAAQNWRSDQAGVLRSRKSNSTAVAIFAGNVHSILSVKRSSGVTRYYGVDDKLYRGAVQVTFGNDGSPLHMASFQDKLWMCNRGQGIQFKDDGTTLHQWTITPPVGPGLTAAGIGTGSLTGEYIYYCSDLNADGDESSAKFGAATGVIATDKITVDRGVPGDPQVTHFNVYRQGGSFPLQAYKVNSDPVPIGSTYVDDGADHTGTGGDDQTDYGIASLGVPRPIDHDAAPPARGVAGPYFNKLLCFSTTLHPNRIFWTPSDEPSYFPGSDSEQDGNWVDVGEEGEEILGIAVFPRFVVVLKEKTIHRLVGDPDDWGADLERTNAEVGQMGATSWAIAGSTVYGEGSEYLFAFNGDRAEKISLPLDPIFKGDTVLTAGAIPSVSLGAAQCMAYRLGRLYVSYASMTLVYEADRWFTDTRAFTALYDEGQTGKLLGAYGGSVYELESGTAEANVPLIYQSRYQDQGEPENQKRYSDVLIEHNTGGRTFTAYAYLDNGSTILTLGTFASSSRTQTSFTLDTAEYRNLAIRLECLTGNAAAEIYTLAAHYLPLERNARTYDTGKIPLEKVSLLGALEAELEILAGTVNYTFSWGVEGLPNAITGTWSGTLKTFTAQIPDGSEARWVRLTLSGDNFRCHGARLQLQPYGCYLTGVGDIFRSGDLTFDSPRIKLLQQVRVDCDPDGAIEGDCYSDTPDPMASRARIELAATAARTWQRTGLPLNTRGRVCRVELTATSVCRLYAIQVRAKIVGEGSSGWQWFDVPVPPTPAGFSWFPLALK